MKVPFLSFAPMNSAIRTQAIAEFQSFFDEQWYVLGSRVERFEEAFAAFCQTNQCIGVANGLDALIVALKTLNIGPGDEVIVPTNTYIATWLAVSYVGATPIPVEPNSETYNIDVTKIARAITSKTKAIMPVHLYGQAAEMQAIMAIADANNLFVIEDNAQAQGAVSGSQNTGSIGHINATSFYPGKNLGAFGDAGAITTNDIALAKNARIIRNYGSEKKYYNEVLGINSRLDELQAGLLSLKLPHLAQWNNQRQAVANFYTEHLQGVGDVITPITAPGCSHVYHLYVIRSQKRDFLQKHLTDAGVGTLIHYPIPPHLQEAYEFLGYKEGNFPIAEELAATSLSLPIYPGITAEQQAYVVATIKAFFS